MKVEFFRNKANDLILIIKESEFVKAKNNSREFESLHSAIKGYCGLFCFDYKLSKNEYAKIVKLAKKGDDIIFCAEDIGHYDYVLEIYLKRGDTLLKIVET